jgi:hypothetical protein
MNSETSNAERRTLNVEYFPNTLTHPMGEGEVVPASGAIVRSLPRGLRDSMRLGKS